jgi:hypothetical protein
MGHCSLSLPCTAPKFQTRQAGRDGCFQPEVPLYMVVPENLIWCDESMAAFIIVATRDSDKIKASVEEFFDEASRLELTDDVWLVDYDGTTQLLADKLKIRNKPSIGSGVVFPVTNYSGKASADVWEWLNAHLTSRKA